MVAAARRLAPIVLLGVLPAVVAVSMLAVAWSTGSLSVDFHDELYREAQVILDGDNPFPPPGTDLSHGHNLIWPPLAAGLVAPLTTLPPGAADVVMALVGLGCFALALWLVGLRDWRVYGACTLWPQIVGEMRVSHLTPILCLLVAGAWRLRGHRFAPGVALGAAIALKFFVWPVAVWLAAAGRRAAAVLALTIAAASLLLVLPFTSLHDYLRVLTELGRTFDQESYSPFGLLVQAGVSETAARAVAAVLGLALIAAAWRLRSLGLAVASALVLSPIVWLDYYALTAIPLALARPRLSWIWLLPVATWGLVSAGVGAGNGWGSARVLAIFAVVVAVTVRAELTGAESLHAATPRAPRSRAPAGTG